VRESLSVAVVPGEVVGLDIKTAVYIQTTMSGGTVATVGLKGLFLAVSR